jgi:hypothetical protein
MAYNLLLLLLPIMMMMMTTTTVMMIIIIIIPALYLWGSRQYARTLFKHAVKYTHTEAPGPML